MCWLIGTVGMPVTLTGTDYLRRFVSEDHLAWQWCLSQRHLILQLSLQVCRGCHLVRYCDSECQSADWEGPFGHKAVCKKIASR